MRMKGPTPRPWATIVGNVRHNGVEALVKEKFYVPVNQFPAVTTRNLIRTLALVVKTTGDPLTAAAPIRSLRYALNSPSTGLAGC